MEIVHHHSVALGLTNVSGFVLSYVQVDGGGKTGPIIIEQWMGVARRQSNHCASGWPDRQPAMYYNHQQAVI